MKAPLELVPRSTPRLTPLVTFNLHGAEVECSAELHLPVRRNSAFSGLRVFWMSNLHWTAFTTLTQSANAISSEIRARSSSGMVVDVIRPAPARLPKHCPPGPG